MELQCISKGIARLVKEFRMPSHREADIPLQTYGNRIFHQPEKR